MLVAKAPKLANLAVFQQDAPQKQLAEWLKKLR